MGRGQQSQVASQSLLYGQRRLRLRSPRLANYNPELTMATAAKRLLKLDFTLGSSNNIVKSDSLYLPEYLHEDMIYTSATLYAHPYEGEVRLLLYPSWDQTDGTPTLAREPMRRLYGELLEQGLGKLMIEFECDSESFADLESLVGARHIRLTAPENTEDGRSEAELLRDICEEARFDPGHTTSLSQLLRANPRAMNYLFSWHSNLMVAVPVAALAARTR